MTDAPFMPDRRDPLDRTDVDPVSLPYRDPVQEDQNRRLLETGAPIRVYVDDVRRPSRAPEQWVIVRTAYEAVQLLRDHDVAELSLDHDFGVGDLREQGVSEDLLELVGEGYDVIRWLEQQLRGEQRDRVPEELNVHSANPVGTRQMIKGIESLGRVIELEMVGADPRSWRRRP
jgi:hypothetical protein